MSARVGLLLIIVAAAAAGTVQALTYVHVSDAGLTAQAEVIARVEVVESRVITSGKRISTEYTMLVHDLVKGLVDGAYLTVRVPGGYSEELGVELRYSGAPRFDTQSRALLFLKSDSDGSFHVLHFVMGAFRETTSASSPVFVRGLPEPVETTAPSVHVGRDAGRFLDWIRSTVAGEEREADYFVALAEESISHTAAPFTVREPVYILWDEFHNNERVTWSRHKSGQAGVPGKGKKELGKVFKVLNKTPNSADTRAGLVNLKLKGKFPTSKVPDRATKCVLDNVFIFNDEIGIRDDFVCTGTGQIGGVIATGGSCRFTTPTSQWKGQNVFGAVSGFVNFNANTACFFRGDFPFNRDTPRNKFSEVAIHEVLHALGLRHACGDDNSPKCSKSDVLDDATMRASVHADGRGAQLREDDLSGFWQLYDPDYFAAGCDLPPGHKRFCKRCGPCGEGQGKCTKNSQCSGDLQCRSDAALGYKTCQ